MRKDRYRVEERFANGKSQFYPQYYAGFCRGWMYFDGMLYRLKVCDTLKEAQEFLKQVIERKKESEKRVYHPPTREQEGARKE